MAEPSENFASAESVASAGSARSAALAQEQGLRSRTCLAAGVQGTGTHGHRQQRQHKPAVRYLVMFIDSIQTGYGVKARSEGRTSGLLATPMACYRSG